MTNSVLKFNKKLFFNLALGLIIILSNLSFNNLLAAKFKPNRSTKGRHKSREKHFSNRDRAAKVFNRLDKLEREKQREFAECADKEERYKLEIELLKMSTDQVVLHRALVMRQQAKHEFHLARRGRRSVTPEEAVAKHDDELISAYAKFVKADTSLGKAVGETRFIEDRGDLSDLSDFSDRE